MKYTSEERADAGGVSGALMHFLMEWSLTPQQEAELQAKLSAKLKGMSASNPKYRMVTNPKVMGAANVKTDEENSFSIISAILNNNKSTPTLVTSGRAPVIPGGKVAVAALLEKNAAQLMAASFEKSRSITDVSVALRYRYDVLMPAVQGKLPSTGLGSTPFTNTTKGCNQFRWWRQGFRRQFRYRHRIGHAVFHHATIQSGRHTTRQPAARKRGSQTNDGCLHGVFPAFGLRKGVQTPGRRPERQADRPKRLQLRL
ncbi:MAG: hypothetical protein IPL65_11025 [Lewinellaceae bacterium]|nr:hypothetical protein [Lewinellaceae bacterium]